MTGARVSVVLWLFLAGWPIYGMSLRDFGQYSLSLLLIGSAALSLLTLRAPTRLLLLLMAVVLSGGLAFVVSRLESFDDVRPTTHLLQQLLGVGVACGTAAIAWEFELTRLRRVLLTVGVIVLAYGVYQYFARRYSLPFAYLSITNLQYGADGGEQRGGSAYGFHRVSSFFIEPSDLGRFMLWLYCFGLTDERSDRRQLFLGIAIAGILLSQSLGAALCACLLSAVAMQDTRRLGRILISLAVALVLLLLAIQLFPEELAGYRTRFLAAINLDAAADSNRVARIPSNVAVFQEAPWLGHGLATSTTVEPSGVAIGYFLLLIERGIVGTLLFFLPACWAAARLMPRSARAHEFAFPIFLLLVVELYCAAAFAMIYFPPFWFALGLGMRAAFAVRQRSWSASGHPAEPSHYLQEA